MKRKCVPSGRYLNYFRKKIPLLFTFHSSLFSGAVAFCSSPFCRRSEIKKGRKNPTQHNHHIITVPSSQRQNGRPGAKSVFRTKTVVSIWRTFHLEKLKNPCYLIVTKRRYPNSKSSGGLPKSTVNQGNQSDFKSK